MHPIVLTPNTAPCRPSLAICSAAPGVQGTIIPPNFPVAARMPLSTVTQITLLSCLNSSMRIIAFGIKLKVLPVASCPSRLALPTPPPSGHHQAPCQSLDWTYNCLLSVPGTHQAHCCPRTFALDVSSAWNSLFSDH